MTHRTSSKAILLDYLPRFFDFFEFDIYFFHISQDTSQELSEHITGKVPVKKHSGYGWIYHMCHLAIITPKTRSRAFLWDVSSIHSVVIKYIHISKIYNSNDLAIRREEEKTIHWHCPYESKISQNMLITDPQYSVLFGCTQMDIFFGRFYFCV